jgi:hypothetical protein
MKWFKNRQFIKKLSHYTVVGLLSCGFALYIYFFVIKKSSISSLGVLNWNKDLLYLNNNEIYKFIIIMATYQRNNSQSYFYVQRAVYSIMMQKYNNWELYATGDQYLDKTEFEYIFRHVPKSKLFLYNLEKPGERNNVPGSRLWLCAGATALNNALDRAEKAYQNSKSLERNELIVAHLDDDDTWHPNHLSNLAEAYLRFPTVKFVWSKGYYCTSSEGATVFPNTDIPDTINNMPPTFARTLHSTVSWKMKTFLSFRYRRDWEYNSEPPAAADADMWRRMSYFMHARNISFYHSLVPTVEHLEEGGRKPCKKADKTPLWYPKEDIPYLWLSESF